MRNGTLFLALTLFGFAGCVTSPPAEPDSGSDGGPSDAGPGVCCPIAESTPCRPGVELGGWAPSVQECGSHVSTWWDGSLDRGLDEHGCDTWTNNPSPSAGEFCCMCMVDAGAP